ncbi:MAG: AMP-binding protein [Bowdeniella nasicola]|nr:AMP-binding protein [Bowdeniella nasicola]
MKIDHSLMRPFDDIDLNPASFLARYAHYVPDRMALIYEDQTFTYGEFEHRVKAIASRLRATGVKEGDRIVYLGMNSEAFLSTMFASWWLGGVFMPLNFRLAPAEISELLVRGTPHSIIVEGSHAEVLSHVYGAQRQHIFLIDDDPAVEVPENVPPYWHRASEVFTDVSEDLPAPQSQGMRDLALLLFTSGTTGVPKGVQLTHGNIWWNSVNVDTSVDSRVGDMNLAVAPLFHIGALNSFTIRAFERGNTTLVRRAFDPVQTLQDIEKYQVNSAFVVPAQLLVMSNQEEFEGADISSLRATICAGAPVPPVIIQKYAEKGVDVQQAWGLTETAPFATYLPAAMTKKKAGSCGISMLHTEVKLMDPALLEEVTTPGETGEMWVRGPNVTPGYWNAPEINETAFYDGWFRSGDIGYADEDGYLFIVDRLKDMIITGGENVYPAEVERVLIEFPGCSDVAVVGQSDPKWGENVVAVMQMDPNAPSPEPNVDQVREFCDRFLARYKLPKKVVLVDSVPRNSSGKLDKRTIRDMVVTTD